MRPLEESTGKHTSTKNCLINNYKSAIEYWNYLTLGLRQNKYDDYDDRTETKVRKERNKKVGGNKYANSLIFYIKKNQ